MKPQTIQQFFKKFKNDEVCLEHLFNIRFGQGYKCSRCGVDAKWYRIKAEKAYSCGSCGNHLHPMVGTPFEASRTSLQLWFYAIYLFTQTRSGVSAKELQRVLGVTYKCAWRMGHEIRKHMGNINSGGKLGGFGKDIEIDESFFHGKGKGAILGIAEKGGDIKTKTISAPTWSNIHPEIIKNVKKTSTVHTDMANIYSDLKKQGYKHEPKNHSLEEYNTPTLDSYWARLKLSIKGTHVFVSPKHLDKYADEFAYRFNSRHAPERMLGELLETFPPLN